MRPLRHNPSPRAAAMSATPAIATTAKATAATVAAALITTLGLTAPPAGAAVAATDAKLPAKAQTEYLAAINAAGDQGVHYVSHATQGSVTFTVTGDTGATSGSQTLSLKEGKTYEHLTVTLIGNTGYVNGNPTALRDVVGASSAVANKYAGHWISFNAKNQQYANFVAGLLNSEVSGELKMNAPFKYGKTKTINGKSAVAIVGTVSDDTGKAMESTLYVAASGPPLPIEQTTGPSTKGTIAGTVQFSNWGQNVTQKAPAHAIPVSKLTASSSSTTTTTKG